MKQVIASRVLTIPDGVEIEIRARQVRVKGPRGICYLPLVLAAFPNALHACMQSSPAAYRLVPVQYADRQVMAGHNAISVVQST